MTERLHFHVSLSCIGEGNGNPLQCSCLENPRDRGAWWAAIYGVAQNQTGLKRLSSSSSNYQVLNQTHASQVSLVTHHGNDSIEFSGVSASVIQHGDLLLLTLSFFVLGFFFSFFFWLFLNYKTAF